MANHNVNKFEYGSDVYLLEDNRVSSYNSAGSGLTIDANGNLKIDSNFLNVSNALIFKGTLGTAVDGGTVQSLPGIHSAGDVYKVVTEGTYNQLYCEVGDLVICITDSTTSNTSAAHWTVVQTNETGVVTGPGSSVSGNLVAFNDDQGKTIADTGYNIGNLLMAIDEVVETSSYSFAFVANGNTATFLSDYSSATNLYTVQETYTRAVDVKFAQVLNPLDLFPARIYVPYNFNVSSNTLSLFSIDNGILYTAVFQTSGIYDTFTTGTFTATELVTENNIYDFGLALDSHLHDDRYLKLVDNTEKNLIPIASKTYASSEYYAKAANNDAGTWFFFKITPDDWYKPWQVKFKVYTFCPGNSAYQSLTYSTYNGRQNGVIYSNWNELSTSAHYYTSCRPLKLAGFDAGYGHALGVTIYNASNSTNSAYYRTFVVDLLSYENCTVDFLDTPLLWADWPNNSTTYYEALSVGNAVSRGLQETGDTDTTADRETYFCRKTGAKGIWNGALFMEAADGTYQCICTASDGTATASNRTVAATKKANPAGFRIGGSIYYSTTNVAPNTNITSTNVVYNSYGIFDSRYSFNTTLTDNSLEVYKPIYLVGYIQNDTYVLDATQWWTQTPNDTSAVYVLVGNVYDSTTSNCRIALTQHNKWLVYNGTTLVPYDNAVFGVDWQDINSTPTTLAGYGITDANINNGVITLGSNTITPLTSLPSHTHGQLSNDGKLGSAAGKLVITGTGGIITTGEANDVGLATTIDLTNHTHTTTIAADSGTSALALQSNTKYKLTAGGTTFIFTTPVDNNTTYEFDGGYDATSNKAATLDSITSIINNTLNLSEITNTANKTIDKISETGGVISVTFKNISITKSQISDFPSTMTPSSHTHGNITNDGKIGSTRYQIVSTGVNGVLTTENSLDDLGIAHAVHDHDLSIATTNKTNQITLAANTKYELTAGGKTYVFTTQPNTTISHTHGNITYDGKMTNGTSGQVVYVTTNGVITAGGPDDIGAAHAVHDHDDKYLKLSDLNSITQSGTIGTNQQYAVILDTNGKLSVNVPWINTWVANSATQNGYVSAAGNNNVNKVWGVNDSGNPGWINVETLVGNSLGTSSQYLRGDGVYTNVLYDKYVSHYNGNESAGYVLRVEELSNNSYKDIIIEYDAEEEALCYIFNNFS